jgi:hypothetical protein
MLLCPAKLAKTRTVTPLLASRVINVLRPEWLEAPHTALRSAAPKANFCIARRTDISRNVVLNDILRPGAISALTTGSIGLRLYVNTCYRSSKSQKVGRVWRAVGVSIQIGFKKVDSIGDDAVAAQSQQVLCGQVVVDGVV